jgi:hypothetical protein
MTPFYLVVALNVTAGVLTLLSFSRRSKTKRRALITASIFLVNLVSIITASYNWVVGGVILGALVVVFLGKCVKEYSVFEHHAANAAVRFNSSTSKHNVISYCKRLRKDERAAKTFGPIPIARAIEHASSRGLEFVQAQELLPVAMTLTVALSEPIQLTIDVIVLTAHLFQIPYERSFLMEIADELVVSAQRGLPLERAYTEFLSFRNTAYRNHNRFHINEVLAAMMTLSREGIEEVGAALGEVYNTLDRLGERYLSLQEAVEALRDRLPPFLTQH